MARINNLTNFLNDVSSAIKQKTGDNTPIPASDFDTEILSIETGGNYQSKTLNVTQNGNYNLLPDQEFDALSNVNISVSVSPVLQNKTVTENGSYSADSGYDGLGTVIVNVPQEGGSGDIKLFETEQAMQADPNPSEGDLAVVYRNDIIIPSPRDTISSITPPNTVVFDTAITSSASLNIRNMFARIYLSCRLTASQFYISDMYRSVITDVGQITYTSSDGITYTRTDGGTNTYDLGAEITLSSTANVNILQFLQSGGMVFEGLYEYVSRSDDYFTFGNFTNVSGQSYPDYVAQVAEPREKIMNILTPYLKENGYTLSYLTLVRKSTTEFVAYCSTANNAPKVLLDSSFIWLNNKTYIAPIGYVGESGSYKIDINTETQYCLISPITATNSVTVGGVDRNYFEEITDYTFGMWFHPQRSFTVAYDNDGSWTSTSRPVSDLSIFKYRVASTQLTLANSNQLLPDIVGYGKNGVIIGDNSIYDNLNKLTLANKVLSDSISSTHILASTYRNFNSDMQTRFFKKTNTMNSNILIDIPNIIYVDNTSTTIYPNSDGTKYYYTSGSGTYSMNIYVCDTATKEILLHIENVYVNQYAKFGDYLYYIDAANGLKKLNINTLTSTLIYDFDNGGTVPSSIYALDCSLFKVDNDTLFFGACYNMNNTTTSKVYACVIKPSTDTVKPYVNTTIVVRETTSCADITAYVTSTNIYCEVFYAPSGANRVRLYSYNRNTDTFVGQLFDIKNNPTAVTTDSHWALPYANGFIASYDNYSNFAYYDLTNKTVTKIADPYAADGTTAIEYPSRLHLLYNGDIMYDHSSGVWTKVLGITYDNDKYIITESEPFKLSGTFYHNEQLVSVNLQTAELIIDYENHTVKGPVYGISFLSLQDVYGFGITDNAVTVDNYDFCIIEGAPYVYANPYKLITGTVIGTLDIQNAEVENGILKEVEENA